MQTTTYQLANGQFAAPSSQKAEKDNAVCWLHLENPSEAELAAINQEYSLPKDYLFPIYDPDEIARVESLGTSGRATLITILIPLTRSTQGHQLEESYTRPFVFVLTDETIITASAFPFAEQQQELLAEWNKQEHQNGSRELILFLLFQVTRRYVQAIRKIADAIPEMEAATHRSTSNRLFYQMMTMQKSLSFLASSIKRNQPVFTRIAQDDGSQQNTTTQDLAHDIQIENSQAENMVNEYLSLLDQISDLISAIQSNRLNLLMKFMTSVSIVLTVPTIIAGLWGMNVKLPIANWPHAFWWLCLLCVGVSVALQIWLNRKHYK